MAQVEIPLTEEQLAGLEQLAEKRRISLAELIQQGVASLLRPPAGGVDSDRKARALAVAGHFRSGCGDLARRHDDYLAGAPSR
jgi:hypothetical protein